MDELDTIPDLPLSEDFYDAQSLKHAVWQYLLNHCYGKMTDEYKFTLFVPSEKEFWRRVSGRKYGKYTRHDIAKIHQDSLKKFNTYGVRIALYEKSQRANERLQALQKRGGIHYVRWQLIIWLRLLANKLAP